MEKNGGWYPDRIHNLYNQWNKEFEKYEVDRLKVDESDISLSMDELENEIGEN